MYRKWSDNQHQCTVYAFLLQLGNKNLIKVFVQTVLVLMSEAGTAYVIMSVEPADASCNWIGTWGVKASNGQKVKPLEA